MIFSSRIRIFAIAISFILGVVKASAQDLPIGSWESHLAYNTAKGVATNGNILFAISNEAFFTCDGKSEERSAYSKVEGMSDIGMQCIAYDMATSTVVLVYDNGNIDLFKDHTFYNIPDLKIKTVAGSKAVFQVYTDNGTAYLSTSLGVIVIDLKKKIITDTYQFTDPSAANALIPVRSFIKQGTYFYAATGNGLYRVGTDNPRIQDAQVWEKVTDRDSLTSLLYVNNTLFLSSKCNLYALVSDTLQHVYGDTLVIQHIDAGINKLFMGVENPKHGGILKILDCSSFTFVDSFDCPGATAQAVQLLDGTIWVAGLYTGLSKRVDVNRTFAFNPDGPSDPTCFDMYAHNKNLYIAHGGFGDNFRESRNYDGVSNLNKGKWTYYRQWVYRPFDTIENLDVVLKDERSGILYFGSFLDGLFILKPDGSYELLRQNSIFEPSKAYNDRNQRQVVGVALGQDENLWVTTMGSDAQLYKRTPDGIWSKIRIPNVADGGPCLVDDNGLIWFVSYSAGVVVYNDANGASYNLLKGVGVGNLPSNGVLCIAKDEKNNIWVGTDDGIGIVSNCNIPSNQQAPCDADIPIVQYDKYAGYLFKGSAVQTIAVDGANRKWVGTSEGVWLLSPDASKIIYRFTTDNSPMPSNHVKKITIDKVTGDVYIGTEKGLICYHGTATEGGTVNDGVVAYPNPVPSGYAGTIAIKGLVANADVRITDISGQLVYKTKALGGQAVWNGFDYTGRRPQTGVYLVFVTNSDGTQVATGKIVFMQ